MNRTEEFISQCLEGVPRGKYRLRTERELRDHLECQRQAFTEEEALRSMGDPERLREEYEAAWRRRPESRLREAADWLGAAVLGSMVLSLMYYLMTDLLRIPVWLGKDTASQFLGGSLFFWAPFAAEAVFLRFRLRSCRHQGVLIAAGLLASWTLGTVLFVDICLAMGEYAQYGLLPPAWTDRLALFYRDMRRSDAPWITPGYHLMSIAGCVFLGWLFGRRPVKTKRELARDYLRE